MKKLHYLSLIFFLFTITTISFSSCTQSRGEGSNLEIKISDEESIAALLPRKNDKEGQEEYDMPQFKCWTK